MNEELAERYRSLIYHYETEPWLKDLVLASSKRHSRHVRPDATFFLLVNFDAMILAPIRGGPPKYAGLVAVEESQYRREMGIRVETGLDIIFSNLREVDEVSAHQVLRAIDQKWPELVLLFGWG